MQPNTERNWIAEIGKIQEETSATNRWSTCLQIRERRKTMRRKQGDKGFIFQLKHCPSQRMIIINIKLVFLRCAAERLTLSYVATT